jgi:glycosyltransferase involved in cell wall biosynthesis
MKTWHIITCEYPPQIGGVSDYTRLLAQHLQCAGDKVHVWAPGFASEPPEKTEDGVHLHRSLGDFLKPHLSATEEQINQIDKNRPRTFLVQWVPQGYGKRAMNMDFCLWLRHLVKYGNRLELMVHEPYLESGQGSWKQRIVAQVHRRMIRIVLESVSRVYMSIPAWERYLRPYAPSDREMIWLPIPATVQVVNDMRAISARRRRIGEQSLILGHLGTYSSVITSVLGPALISILRAVPNAHSLLLGSGNEPFAVLLKSQAPELENRIHAAGLLTKKDLSHHLSACDLMLQPFPDGLTSRRTSLMNALAHGLPVVSSSGHLTEELWEESRAVALAATGAAPDLAEACIRLLLDPLARKEVAERGATLYRSRFDWCNIVASLRLSPDARMPVAQSSNHLGNNSS